MDDEQPLKSTLSRRRVLVGGGAAGATLLGTQLGSVPAALATGTAPAPGSRPFREAELVLLGTAAGPPPEPDRVGIASVLHVDGKNYMVDCGRSSVTQYYNIGLAFSDLDSIFITHLHADHICDYYNVFLLAGWGKSNDKDEITQRVHVYGPGPAGALSPAFDGGEVPTINPDDPTPGLADMTKRLINAYAYSTNVFMRDSAIPDPRTLIDVHEISIPDVGAKPLGPTAPTMSPFTVMEDDRVKVTAVLVPHGPVFPSFAYRFDTEHGSVVFSGDTSLTPNIVTLAKNADILVHEAIDLEALGERPPAVLDHLKESHTSVADLGRVAEAANVKTLVLSHLVPAALSIVTKKRWRSRAQKGFGGEVIVGADLMRLRIERGQRYRR